MPGSRRHGRLSRGPIPLADAVAEVLATGLELLRCALRLVPDPAVAGAGLALATDAAQHRAPALGGASYPAEPAASVMSVVARAQSGDVEAFGEIYDRHVELIYRYVYYRSGDASLAEDLTSETFLRALRRIDTFRWQGRDVGAWLVTIARNLMADHYKSARYRFEIPTGDLPGAGADRVEDGPEDEVLTRLTNDELLAAVSRLGAEQRECVVLRFLQGMSVAETAAAMSRSEGAVKTLQYRAVRSLAGLLPDGVRP